MPLFGYVPEGTSGPLRRGRSSNVASRYRGGRHAWLDVGDFPGEVLERSPAFGRCARPVGPEEPRSTPDALEMRWCWKLSEEQAVYDLLELCETPP
jgi:hypothetical protein